MSQDKDCKIQRKLTQDWTKEIKLKEYLKTVSRSKRDCSEEIHTGYIQLEKPLTKFPTGSTYEGKYNSVGFAGIGVYVFPHGNSYIINYL